MKIKLEYEWQYPCMCPVCRTVFWSNYPGEYVTCECRQCFCDQTEYYGRYGGGIILMKPIDEGTE